MKPSGPDGYFEGNVLILNSVISFLFYFPKAKYHFYLFSSLTDISYGSNLFDIYKHMEIYKLYLPQGEKIG